MTNRRTEKARLRIVVAGIMVVLLIITVVGAMINRYTPTKAKMSGYDYFETNNDGSVVIMLNNVVSDTKGVIDDGRVYIPQSYIASSVNQRFYYDRESNSVLFTNATDIYTFTTGSKNYIDSKGNSYSEEYEIVKNIDDELYIAFEFVCSHTDIVYDYYEEPSRLIISNDYSDNQYVTVTKSTSVRYRGGIKSKVLESVKEEDKLLFKAVIDDWIEVQTASGYVGYVKSNCVSDVYTESVESTYSNDFTSISKSYKISLAWFQVMNKTANNTIDSYLAGTSGINTISPTWYSITSNAGDMSCLATSDFVSNMHSRGYEVWPLVDDFDDNLDGEILYSSQDARTKMINTLIRDANTYGYDGLNIDFEKVTSSCAPDFLQFLRELSIKCRSNNIVLSTDAYKPASFNMFYDLKEQGTFADYVIIMGYDEHYAGSDSGSVASINFVREGITGALEQVPNDKLINAVPFYTRIWTVATTGGVLTTTSKAVGMQAAIDDLSANGVPAIWDESFGQYFGSYEKADGSVVKIWIEEDRSIEEKMKLVSQYELAGVAEWKLGLEKKSVWSVISKYNK